MRIFAVCDHEPLPTDPGERRLMRAGMLTAALAEAGHEVTWFTSSFDHYLKRQRSPADATIEVAPRLTIRQLAAPGYPRNISARRVAHNVAFANAFDRAARDLPAPDAVIAAIPATDSAAMAVRFAKRRGAVSLIDIYDPWPDSFRQIIPGLKLALGAPVIALLRRQARLACTNATGLLAISETYLQWGRRIGRRAYSAPDRVFPLSYMPVFHFDAAERTALLERLGIEPHHRVVSFVGSWGSTHDFDPILAAARELSTDPNIRFVLAGNSEAAIDLSAAFCALANTSLPGWLSARELAILLTVSDVGLLPYRADAPQTLPNKVFEYMAYGTYQIGTLRGETETIYERTGAGRVVAPTGRALVVALREYLNSPATMQRSSRIAAFRAYYAGPAIYRDMVAHIEKIVSARR